MDNSSVSKIPYCGYYFAMSIDRHSIDSLGDVWKVIHYHFLNKSVVYVPDEECPRMVQAYVWDSVDGWLPISVLS